MSHLDVLPPNHRLKSAHAEGIHFLRCADYTSKPLHHRKRFAFRIQGPTVIFCINSKNSCSLRLLVDFSTIPPSPAACAAGIFLSPRRTQRLEASPRVL